MSDTVDETNNSQRTSWGRILDVPPSSLGHQIFIEAVVQVRENTPPPPPPPIPYVYSFVADPARIKRGESVRLSFSGPPEVATVYVDGRVVPFERDAAGVMGAATVQPEQDETYLFTAEDGNGNVLRKLSADVVVEQPVVPYEYSFTATPERVKAGESVLLRFTAPPGVRVVTLDPVADPVFAETLDERGTVGTAVIWPVASEEFALDAYNAGGDRERTLSLILEVEQPAPPPPPPVPDPLTFPRLDASCFEYEGSCTFDNDWRTEDRIGYGGEALTWDARSETFLIAGFDSRPRVARYQLPELVKVGEGPLRKAIVVEGFFDPVDGLWSKVADRSNAKVGGMLPWGDKLLASIWFYYDAVDQQKASHFVSERFLNMPNDAVGPFKIGALKTGYTSRYMADVPMAWRELLGGPAFAGHCTMPIVSRTSSGPCAFSFNPDDVGGPVNPVPATPLVYYPYETPLEKWSVSSEMWNGNAEVGGIAMPDGTRSLLFFGSFGPGDFCYGTSCYPGAGQAPHAVIKQPDGTYLPAPYYAYVWEYDAAELAAVRRGELKPWVLRPRYWRMTLPISGSKTIRGVAFDRARQRLLLSQRNGESVFVHAYRVRVPA